MEVYIRIVVMVTALFSLGLQACSKSPNLSPTVNADSQQTTQQQTTWIEQDIAAGALHGLYINAGESAPIALIVPGSGPTDRDGNSGAGLRPNTYKHLAQQLAAKGISSVRVDKRGMYSSAKAGDANAVTIEIYAQDYRNWIDVIKAETGAECVYLIGHSEGGLMVSSAAIGRSDICGLILVAAVGRPMGTVLREQLKANPANKPILKQALDAITRLEAGKNVDTEGFHPALKGLFHEPVQGFLISVMAADPAKIAGQAKQKTLIIQGNNDIQVSVQDAELLRAATKGQLVLLDDVNHVLKIAPKDRRGNIKTYSDPDLPVADGVINAIAEFMLE